MNPQEIWTRGGLLFGKMWEDSNVEIEHVREIVEKRGQCRVLAVASAGDTAFALAAVPGCEVIAVDINPAQVHLCRLKQKLLKKFGLLKFRDFLHSDVRPALSMVLAELEPDTQVYWRRYARLLKDGFHAAGRVDKMMSFWVWLFSQFVLSRSEIDRFLALRCVQEQELHVEKYWQGWQWDLAWRLAFHPWVLKFVYGAELVASLSPDFKQHMKQRLRHFLVGFEAWENPYLWQTFSDSELGPRAAPYLEDFGEVDFRIGSMEAQNFQEFDYFSLSNILEVAGPQQCQEVLRTVTALADPGAIACLRFMAPRQLLWPQLEVMVKESDEAQERDRAFFCNQFQIYRLKR